MDLADGGVFGLAGADAGDSDLGVDLEEVVVQGL